MIRFGIIVSLLAFVTGIPTYSVDDSRIGHLNGDSRIIGGSDAPDGEYPFIVSVRSATNSLICSGSILNTEWILTTASCLVGRDVLTIRVVAGTNTLNAGGVSIVPKTFTLHPEYNTISLINNIGLIELSQTLTFSSAIAPVALNSAPTGAVPAISIGWGQTHVGGAVSNNLQHLHTSTITNTECQIIFGITISDSVICALDGPGSGNCNGDSGNPLIRASTRVLLGLSSFGRGSGCAMGYPDGYTRVSSYILWIEDAIASVKINN